MEGPGKAAVCGFPLFRDCRKQIPPWVSFQETVYQIGQVLGILGPLAMKDIKRFEFPGLEQWVNQFLNTGIVSFGISGSLCATDKWTWYQQGN